MPRAILLTVALALVPAIARPAAARPLDAAQVAGGARWMVHVDIDELKRNPVVADVKQRLLQQPQVRTGLDAILALTGFDARQGLHGVTVYGNQFTPNAGVAILDIELDPQRTAAALAANPGYSRLKHGEHVIHRWPENQASSVKSGKTAHAVFYGPRTVVFSHRGQDLRAAIDVLAGAGGNLAANKDRVPARIPEGTILYATAEGLGEALGPQVRSPLFKRAHSLTFTLRQGEQGLDARADIDFLEGSEEIAGNVVLMLGGLQAMARIQLANHPDLQTLIDAVIANKQGSRVLVDASLSNEQLAALVAKAERRIRVPR
ncbi:MAG: hypothetical protein OER86_01475 [Phycisphaerae bacterium]|nr:hypothetical protein [Phycisphaerae bacterium]